MTKLSVNINKFATLRNSRGGNNPDVVKGEQKLITTVEIYSSVGNIKN